MVEKTDDRSHIPEQILKQGEEAERLHREFLDSLKPPDGSTGIIEKPEQDGTGGTGGTGSADIIVQKDAVTQQQDEELRKAKEKAEHKYDVLKGKYDTEIHELTLKLTQALNAIDQYREELAASKTSDKEAAKAVDEKSKAILAEIEADPSVQYLKNDLPDVWKAVNLVVDKKLSESSAEIKKLKDKVEITTSKTVQDNLDKFYDGLSDKVEGWEVINKSPEFIEWLSEEDPFAGATRKQLIQDAYSKMDVKRTARFFTSYIEEKGLAKKPESTAQGIKTESTATKKTDIAPTTVTTRKPEASDADKDKREKIKSSEVSEYYRELERLTKFGQPISDEMKVRGLQIEKAIAEGRVI